jgi:hypothetical protein
MILVSNFLLHFFSTSHSTVTHTVMNRLEYPLGWEEVDKAHVEAVKAAFDKFREGAIGSADEQLPHLTELEVPILCSFFYISSIPIYP